MNNYEDLPDWELEWICKVKSPHTDEHKLALQEIHRRKKLNNNGGCMILIFILLITIFDPMFVGSGIGLCWILFNIIHK